MLSNIDLQKLPLVTAIVVLSLLTLSADLIQPVSAKRCASISKDGAYAGSGTHYDPTIGQGACAYDPPNQVYPKNPSSPEELYVAAISKDMYLDSQTCGSCLEVCASGKCTLVRVIDRCPSCSSGDLDLSPQAFSKLDALDAGRIGIQWKLAPCPAQYSFYWQAGITSDWAGFQIRGQPWPINTLELMQGGSWVALPRQYDNFYKARGLGLGSITVKVSLVDGTVVELKDIPIKENSVTTPGNVQYISGGSPQPSAPQSNSTQSNGPSNNSTSTGNNSTQTPNQEFTHGSWLNTTTYGITSNGPTYDHPNNPNSFLPFPNTCEESAAVSFSPNTALVAASFILSAASVLLL
ncbi:RlpA-like double-psi beta-barrel-protein domain-containing protein-containing protein [Paraphysoderma sedebokerense]|nr:RlpA-like double-psi beta-barrel-protein domain-containing protein-containing protein [Paraphysoderma sedebokerense]